jgi:LDH2 family malate/lactate/ureidoglycolate dehydrogenase
MEIKIQDTIELSRKVLGIYGYTDSEAVIITNSLIWAQKRGSSQGLNKLFGWRMQKRSEAEVPSATRISDSSILIDAGLGSHMVACDHATDELLAQIEDKAIFVAGINNTDNSAGALGYYTERIARAGYVGIMMSAADPGVVIYGGKSPVLGTNPISIAVPTKNDPLLLDMSTASLTWGDLVKYDNESKSLPEGLAFDNEGSPTTDPKKAMDGWVTTFDKSYKSSGLALMIQILAGPLVGSIYSKDYNVCQYGSLIIAINPRSFGDKEVFLESVELMVGEIKESDKTRGFTEILLPGERGYQTSNNLSKEGLVEVSPELMEKINGLLGY